MLVEIEEIVQYLFLILILLLSSCTKTVESNQRWTLIEDSVRKWASSGYPISLYPNDANHGDSVLVQFERGIFIETRPGVNFALVIEYSGDDIPELNLFNTENNLELTIVEGQISGNRIQYEWEQPSGEAISYVASLSSGDEALQGDLSFVEYTGVGGTAKPLGINVHFLGLDERYPTVESRESIAQNIVSEMSEIYGAGGVSMGEVEILTGAEHPLYGTLLKDASDLSFNPHPVLWEVEFNGSQSLSLDSLSGGLDASMSNNLDIVIVPSIQGIGYVGIAPFFGRTLGSGYSSVAVVGASTQVNSIRFEENSDSLMANTLAHEIGHFLGLRHTTSTSSDIQVNGDRSILEDGLASTPFDESCQSGLGKRIASGVGGCQTLWVRNPHHQAQYRVSKLTTSNQSCGDADNLMFPVVVSGVEQRGFTSEQGDLVQQTLSVLNP